MVRILYCVKQNALYKTLLYYVVYMRCCTLDLDATHFCQNRLKKLQSFWWQEMTTSTLWSCIHYAFIFHIKLISRRKCVQYTEESYTTTWYEEIIHKKSKNIFYIYSEFFNNFDKLCVVFGWRVLCIMSECCVPIFTFIN